MQAQRNINAGLPALRFYNCAGVTQEAERPDA